MKFAFAALAVLALPAVAAAQSSPPPVGVYSCMGRSGPAIPMSFGLLDGANYAVYDGKTGHYSYDTRTGVLSMTDGPLAGIVYKRLTPSGAPTSDASFRMLDGKGNITAYMCPKDGNKNPRQHPW